MAHSAPPEVSVENQATVETKAPVGSETPVVVAEIERKFDIDAWFAVPDLAGLAGVTSVAPAVRHDLDATYYDTADLRLVRNKITLRRRTGGDDAGWHLKLPRVDGDRDEVRAPLGAADSALPPQLRQVVEVHLRGAEVLPAVRLATTRTLTRLLGADGVVLAEVALDQVSASAPEQDGRAASVSNWREVEVELVGGDRELLAALVERVTAAGAVPSSSASKLSRALGDRLPAKPPRLPTGVATSSAGAVLVDHVAEHVGLLKANDPRLRAAEPEAVHQLRVASRRMRSALATFRPLLDRAVTEPLRAELQWLGGVLGAARDAEVTRDQLRALAGAEPPELLLGPVSARIATSLGGRYRVAHAAALEALQQQRYFDLLDALDRLVGDPPLTDRGRLPAAEVLLPLVAKTYRRTRALVEAAQAEPDPERRDLLLHAVRKAAKRARYAGESLIPTHGKDAERWAAGMEAIQEVLGEHQDTVVIRAELRALGVAAHLDGENGFSYGRLHALEQQRAVETERRFERAWRAAGRKKLHRWLR